MDKKDFKDENHPRLWERLSAVERRGRMGKWCQMSAFWKIVQTKGEFNEFSIKHQTKKK